MTPRKKTQAEKNAEERKVEAVVFIEGILEQIEKGRIGPALTLKKRVALLELCVDSIARVQMRQRKLIEEMVETFELLLDAAGSEKDPRDSKPS